MRCDNAVESKPESNVSAKQYMEMRDGYTTVTSLESAFSFWLLNDKCNLKIKFASIQKFNAHQGCIVLIKNTVKSVKNVKYYYIY